jgi:poly(hydroxyalkanoate) granule-associated protein
MVKRLQKMADKQAAAPSGLLDSQLAQTVKDSAHQIWLAGLGAFAKAQGEGGKVFETLIKEGVNLQKKTQAVAEEKLGDVAGKMTAMAGEVGHKANAQWDKLESIFEERTARAMAKLGVPNAKALAALVDRVAALEKALGIAPAEAAAPAKGKPRVRAGKALKDAVPVATSAAPAAPADAAVQPKPARKAARKAATPAADTAAAPVKTAMRRRRAAA